MKLNEQLKAIKLRKSGNSYSEILKEVNVSKSTLSLWLREIKLTPKQEKRLYVDLRQKNAYKLSKFNQQKRIRKTSLIIEKARCEIELFLNNPLFLSGLMLYWAEGDKSEKTEFVKITNSDPAMIKLMMRWFREICKIEEKKFRIALHIHELFCKKDIEKYWSKITSIPLNQFHKTQIKPTSLKHRKNKLYNGTCVIRIGSRDLFRKIKGWKLGFLEKMRIKMSL